MFRDQDEGSATGVMAHSVKCLPHKHGDPCLSLSTHIKNRHRGVLHIIIWGGRGRRIPRFCWPVHLTKLASPLF